jgi:tetratricopeptide (TPR) repeat protein
MRSAPFVLMALAGTAAATPVAAPHAPAAALPAAAPTAPLTARLPGFAASLSEQTVPAGPDAWPALSYDRAWAALSRTTPSTRQAVRWDYARSLIASGDASEALGVLDVMKQDDRDMALVPYWQLAYGAALVQLGRTADALTALSAEMLSSNPEACLWRMRAMSQANLPDQALSQLPCAVSAINARHGAARTPFVVAAARAAVAAGRPAQALEWLKLTPDGDPASNLYRGKAYLALHQEQEGRLRLERVAISGSGPERMDAKLSTVEAAVAAKQMPPAQALKQLEQISFTWRGDDIEQRALRLSLQLNSEAHDLRGSLASGATLFRHFNLGKDAAPMVADLQSQLAAALAPGSNVPLDQAAGLYWDFRDLAPGGAEGDLLVTRLADRLQAAGLYARAAELLQYQLTQRAHDVVQGPLSVRVASLFILSGRPDKALRTIRETNDLSYPQEMTWDRHRVEAAALHLLGKTNEALAAVQDVPNGRGIRQEILWQKQDWAGLATVGEPDLPRPGALTQVEQAVVLRHAIALAMLHREDGLARLRGRYAASFARLPTFAAFDLLTSPVGALDPATLGKAMTALPAASPAGTFADLLAPATKPGPKGA